MIENLHPAVNLNYLDEGEGVPIVFQHGLGGDLEQIHTLFGAEREAFRLICMENINHGDSGRTTDPEQLNLPAFTEDLIAFIEEMDLGSSFLLGGLSMGAALAMKAALSFPDQVKGLILLRPAWLDKPAPIHLSAFLEVADFLDAYGPWEGKELFCRTQVYRELEVEFPACARSILQQFKPGDFEERSALFRGVVNSVPFSNKDALAELKIPVLILAAQQDPLYPYELAEELASLIPHAQLQEIPSWYLSEIDHRKAFQAAVKKFTENL